MKKNYRLIDHTADIAITVTGYDLKSLFKNSALALIDMLFNEGTIKGGNAYTVTAEGDTDEELLINFLREIFFKYAVYNIALNDIKIEELTQTNVKAKLTGEKFDEKKHGLNTDIKAVTYHDVKIEKKGDKLTVSIVFDT